ncbi:MAG: PepSY domain-containing protein [Firmicutes bacterium]|nr:PepSY domain-containing protein [Bacillota bacterium]
MNNENVNLKQTSKFAKKAKILVFLIFVILLIAVATMATTYFTADISASQAMQIAQDFVGSGFATSPDLEWEIWRWLWNVEVVIPENALIHELYIHPNTGAIIRHEISIWD